MNTIFPFPKDTSKKQTLGKLKNLGVTDERLLPLLFPRKYNDIRRSNIIMDFTLLPGLLEEKVYIGCALHGTPQVHFDQINRKKPPRTRFYIKDRNGRTISVTVFGPSEDLVSNLISHRSFCLHGEVSAWNGQIQLKNTEWIDSRWVGKIQPTYPGKTKIINPDTVLRRMIELTDLHASKSIAFLKERFSIISEQHEKELIESLGGDINLHSSLFSIIKSIHAPNTIEDGEAAQSILKRLAARDIVNRLSENVITARKDSALNIGDDILNKVIADMGMSLTNDQLLAIGEIIDDIRSNRSMRRLLTGDVGTGKSIPIAVAAAVVARLGENAIVIMPNEPLAEQMRKDIEAWWPDTQPKLVAGSTKGLPDSRILVGTTALNFRIPENYPRKLLIIDEQQKLSVAQRLALANEDTNVLEASATPLPRSLALIKFGGLPISTLREAYVKKDISTKMIFKDPQQRKELFMDVKKTFQDG